MNRKRDETKKELGDVLQRITLLCAVFLLCVAVLPATVSAAIVEADYSWYDTQKTELTISDVNDLIGFANIVNGAVANIEKDTFEGKTVQLDADIDLTGVVWTPIGSSLGASHPPSESNTKMFAGTFDGCEHTISGLSAEWYSPLCEDLHDGEYSFGLFGYVYGANIANVNLKDVNIVACTKKTSDDTSANGSGVAALIGYYHVADEKTCVIENCHVLSGTVKASNNMGGLIGYMDSQCTQPEADITISDCSNAANVITEAREAGGILGLMNSAREGNNYVTMRGTITFKDCINTGAITSLGGGDPSAGGILGRDHNQAAGQRLKLIFESCKNSGTITVTANGETHAAGIASGFYSHGAWLIAKNCENTGNVVVNNPSNKVYAGGLISYGGVVELINSKSTGSVTVGTNDGNKYVGGAQSILFLEKIDDFSDTIAGKTYYLNGGTSPEYAALVDDAAGGGNFHLVETAYKDGYVFDGWYDNANLDGTVCSELSNTVSTYYAKWKPGITFNANGGTGNLAYETGTHTINTNSVITRENYRFTGWNTEADGTGTSYAEGASISATDSTILYAQWESVITFDANGGTGEIQEMTIPAEKSANLNTNTFTLSNYEFAGWATSSDGSVEYEDGETIEPKGNITLYAQWRGKITFNANGGTGEMEAQEILKGQAVTLNPNTFTKTGYLFNNWNTEADVTGTSYEDEATIPSAKNMVLYANWTLCNAHNFVEEIAEPDYMKSPATTEQKAVYYKSCSLCGLSSAGEEGEATFEYGDVLEKAPVSSNSGSPSSGGTYTTMIRDAPEEGGKVHFKNSASPVEFVTVPAGIVDGQIIVSAVTDAESPEGKDVEAIFEVSITGSYPTGEETVITVELPKSELTKRGLTEADACLYHFNGEEWEKLVTTYEIDGDNIIYHGITTSFSPFALVYEIDGAIMAEEEKPVDEPIEQPPVDEPLEPLPPIEDITTETPETPMPIFGILAGIGCAAVIFRRK